MKTYANAVDNAGDCSNLLSKLLRGGCFVAGTVVSVSQLPWNATFQAAIWEDVGAERDWYEPSYQTATSTSADRSLFAQRTLATTVAQSPLLVPIEAVPLGARVLTRNPRPWEYDDSLPEPEQPTWAKLCITMRRADGGVVDAEIIRPQAWIRRHEIVAGQLLSMHLEELQTRGTALVTAIEPCPEIAEGEGSVVTGRFLTREVHELVHVEVLAANGERETLSGTSIHPIWSVERHDWVPLGELVIGETLQGSAGLARVLGLTVASATTAVYNIEVHGHHVYQVGKIGLLVHNTYPGAAGRLTQSEQAAIRKIGNIESGHLKPHDYTGTLRDMVGNPVPKKTGGYWDHAQEMNNSLQGLRKHIKTLSNSTDPSAVTARQRAEALIKKIIEHTEGAGI